MKRTMLATILLGGISANVYAAAPGPADGDIDTTSAEIHWVAQIPTVVPGDWVMMTGLDGGAVQQGELVVNSDGSFTSNDINLEVRFYDAATSQVGAPITLNPADATAGNIVPVAITYQAEALSYSSKKGVDTTGANAYLLEDSQFYHPMTPGAEYTSESSDAWKTSWRVASMDGGQLPTVIAGDTITATTVIRADVEFAAL